jgi:hypothetical protein
MKLLNDQKGDFCFVLAANKNLHLPEFPSISPAGSALHLPE